MQLKKEGVVVECGLVRGSCYQWPFRIVGDVDVLLGAMEDDELGALVKKLSPFSFRCSGRSSLTLASSMSAVMAAMRASVR